MSEEREVLSGMLSTTSAFRLMITGDAGVREIDRLIQKLNIDRQILAEHDAALVAPATATPQDSTSPATSPQSAATAAIGPPTNATPTPPRSSISR